MDSLHREIDHSEDKTQFATPTTFLESRIIWDIKFDLLHGE